MTEALNRRLLGPVMFWTVLTTLFAVLPLVRIIGRPEGYNWRILGLAGEGFQGPFWVFILLTVFAVLLLFTGERGPRDLFQPLLILWHLMVLGVVVASVLQGGNNAAWQGQGLHWNIPMWVVLVPGVIFTLLAGVWVIIDRQHPARRPAPWSRANTFRVAGSLVLLATAFGLFRAGTNYNWVTAVAIVTTILHWLVLAWSLAGTNRDSAPTRSDPDSAA